MATPATQTSKQVRSHNYRSYNDKERIKRQIAVVHAPHPFTKTNNRARQH